EFKKRTIEFLGYNLSENSISLIREPTQGVDEYPLPRDKKELQSFLGIVNYYRKFIRDAVG
ncbi:hypothetical protein PAPHI01_2624, partial [Pancytospora philotis]